MLYLGAQTNKGPVAIIGINHENLIRMQAGMPLDIDLKKLMQPGKRITKVIVHYAHTYEEVVNDIEKDGDGLEIPDFVRQEAREKDAEAKREREGRGV